MRNFFLYLRAAMPLGLLFAGANAMAADNPVATPANSAVFQTNVTSANNWTGSALIELTVLGFKPPETGSVQAVVSLEAKGEKKEVGRFTLFPNEDFKASTANDAQRFVFRLQPGELGKYSDAPVTIKVDLVPYGGAGTGARLDIGDAKIVKLP
jgi:hypothetical protein